MSEKLLDLLPERETINKNFERLQANQDPGSLIVVGRGEKNNILVAYAITAAGDDAPNRTLEWNEHHDQMSVVNLDKKANTESRDDSLYHTAISSSITGCVVAANGNHINNVFKHTYNGHNLQYALSHTAAPGLRLLEAHNDQYRTPRTAAAIDLTGAGDFALGSVLKDVSNGMTTREIWKAKYIGRMMNQVGYALPAYSNRFYHREPYDETPLAIPLGKSALDTCEFLYKELPDTVIGVGVISIDRRSKTQLVSKCALKNKSTAIEVVQEIDTAQAPQS